jgi:hypothetical protein
MRTISWLGGGICAGMGILTLAVYGFDQPAGEVSASFSTYGYDALPNLVVPAAGFIGLALIAIGAWLMIKANATAWKQTGGY